MDTIYLFNLILGTNISISIVPAKLTLHTVRKELVGPYFTVNVNMFPLLTHDTRVENGGLSP